MPKLQADQLPNLATILMRLRGDSLRSIGEATSIRSANLSVWLRGREQVISDKRVAGLMYHLGVEGGTLRDDVLHSWHDTGALDDVKAALNTLISNGTTIWLVQDRQPGLTKTRFLRVDETWIRVELTPGVVNFKDLSDVVNVRRVLTLPTPLADIPCDSLQTALDALMTMTERAAVDVGDEDLLEGMIFQLNQMETAELTFNTASPGGWSRLRNALEFALQRGIDPGDIARLIDDSYRNNGGSEACGRKPG